MNLEKLKNLQEKVSKDLILNDENLKDKSLDIGNLCNFYSNLLFQETCILNRLKSNRDVIYGRLYDYYKTSKKPYKDRKPFNICLDSKSEIEVYIKSDEDYEKINLEYSNQEAVCRYIDQTIENIKTMSYHINNQIQFIKIKNGCNF